jgi:tetratricopeptide (TPR) repeat protein
MGRIDGVFWPAGMSRNGTLYLLDLPQNAMAKDAPWFHHYCWGMLSKFRAMTTLDKANRSYEIKTWRDGMTFIIGWVESHNLTWSYMPLIYTERAESYIADKQYVLALADAQKATTLDPSYANAYKVLVETHRAMGEKKEALQAATEGLKYAPDMKVLQDWYTQLGGKLPYPEPYKEPTTETNTSDKAQTNSPEIGNSSVHAPDDKLSTPESNSEITAPTTPNNSENQENNNCRFCP